MKTIDKALTLPLLSIIFILAIGCNNSAPTNSPDDYVISDNEYQNLYFPFSLPFPGDWVVADGETKEILYQASKELVIENNPELEAEFDKAEKRNYQLTIISQHPIGSAVESNPFISITAEEVSQFPNVKNGEDYLAQGTELLIANFPYDSSYEIYEYDLGGKPFYRTDLVLNAATGPVNQSYISMVTGKYVLSFILSGQSEEEIANLEGILQTGNFENISTEVVKSQQRSVSPIQGIVGLLLIISPFFINGIWKWYKRRNPDGEEIGEAEEVDDVEEG